MALEKSLSSDTIIKMGAQPWFYFCWYVHSRLCASRSFRV